MREILAKQEQEAHEQELFEQRLKALEAEEAAIAQSKREEAKRIQLLQRAQAADKKRVIEETVRRDRLAVRASDDMAAGGPVDAKFTEEAQKLLEQEAALGHPTGPLQRLVHKMLNPPLVSGGGRPA